MWLVIEETVLLREWFRFRGMPYRDVSCLDVLVVEREYDGQSAGADELVCSGLMSDMMICNVLIVD